MVLTELEQQRSRLLSAEKMVLTELEQQRSRLLSAEKMVLTELEQHRIVHEVFWQLGVRIS
jgi:uncharacterized protein involved in exopolysaccharide biosynthesis